MPEPLEPEPSEAIPEDDNIPDTGGAPTPEFQPSHVSTPQIQAQNAFTKYIQGQLQRLTNKQEEFEKFYQQYDKRVEKIEDKLDENRTKLVETLGLFIALFTFVSVEFSLFQKLTQISQVLSLTLILGGLLLLFILILDLVLRSSRREDEDSRVWFRYFGRFCLLAIGLIVTGIFIAFLFPRDWDKKIDREISGKNSMISNPTAIAPLPSSIPLFLTPPHSR